MENKPDWVDDEELVFPPGDTYFLSLGSHDIKFLNDGIKVIGDDEKRSVAFKVNVDGVVMPFKNSDRGFLTQLKRFLPLKDKKLKITVYEGDKGYWKYRMDSL